MADLPTHMRAALLDAYDGVSLRVVTRPLPELRGTDVLVRVRAAPVNPSDLLFLKGLYGVKKPLPAVPGWEGSGVVVAAKGIPARALLGRRVAIGITGDDDGTWAEYVRVPLAQCVPLLPSTTDEQGAMLIVNPLTAYAMLDLARDGGHAAAVQTAAASSLGRMMAATAKRIGLPMIHVVRRKEQVELLRGKGYEHVLDSSEAGFEERLRDLAHGLHATILYDAVAGATTRICIEQMPRKSTAVVYGALSEKPAELSPLDFIFRELTARGFYLSDWFRDAGMARVLRAAIAVQSSADFRSEVRTRVGLDQLPAAIAEYQRQMTDGKVLLVP